MSELAQEKNARNANARRASALLDQEQRERVKSIEDDTLAEKMERQSNVRRASALMDLEQQSRVQKAKEDEEMHKCEREVNQRSASKSMDLEQKRRIKEETDAAAAGELEREENVKKVSAAVEVERTRRLSEIDRENTAENEERVSNQKVALDMMDEEQTRRLSAPSTPTKNDKKKVAEVLDELQDEVDENDTDVADVDVAAAKGVNTKLNISEAASANVEEIMKKDEGDESLRKYKLALLGNVGDLGDTSDQRKVVVTEFRVIFEGKTMQDQVFNLDSDEGLQKISEAGVELREGAAFKFQLKFRVNHEILTGLKFTNRLKKGIFRTTEDIVIGSYAPQSDPYTFCLPKDGWNYAPRGMMLRGWTRWSITFIN